MCRGGCALGLAHWLARTPLSRQVHRGARSQVRASVGVLVLARCRLALACWRWQCSQITEITVASGQLMCQLMDHIRSRIIL